MDRETCWDPKLYASNARFVAELGRPLLRLLAPRPGDRILDLGCGDGALTELIQAGGAVVWGMDSSLAQLRAARERGLGVFVMDAECLGLKRRFDAVFSNAALHWMKRPEKVLRGVAAALKPGGRFVGEFGGEGNVQQIRQALHRALARRGIDPSAADPWYYPSAPEYAKLLEAAGFSVASIELVPRPTPLPGDIAEWLRIFAQPFVARVEPADRDAYLEEVRAALAPALRQPDGRWIADYVRLRFCARLVRS